MEESVDLALVNHLMSKGVIHRIGCQVSASIADFAANPLAQIGLLVSCVAWFVAGLPAEILTAALSILAITLTQMVLNKQNEREVDAHRRDIALHAKLDELVLATSRARDELAGIEELEEDEIQRLKLARDSDTAIAKGRALRNAKPN